MSIIGAWLSGFAFTQLVETPIYAGLIGKRRGWPARIAIAFGASAITHPIVWFLLPRIVPGYVAYVVSAEMFAFAIEAIWLRLFRVRRPLLLSLVANGASVTLGLGSRAIFGWP